MKSKSRWMTVLSLLLAVTSWPVGSVFASTEEKLGKVGERDGTAKAALSGPYVSQREQEVPYGYRSFFHAPWRSYMDTWDGSRFLEALGVNYNMERDEAEATATLLQEAGVRSARIEIGWDNLDYYDDSKFREYNRESMRLMLGALKRHNIRPIILLNMNSGMPNPNTDAKVELTRLASKGAREIYVKDPSGIRPKYTGFQLGGGRPAMFPIITDIDATTGRCTLSAPLPQDVPAGEVVLIKLKYQPFSGLEYKDGTPNPAAMETVNGWLRYVKTVTEVAKEELGTQNNEVDAGFDLEIYNEYTFGYHYLGIEHYYDPKPEFRKPISFTKDGKTVEGHEMLLPLTADYVKNPENKLPGVNVVSGFSNQRPFDNGSTMGVDEAGFSRHYYSGYDKVKSLITPESASDFKESTKLYLNALEGLDGTKVPDKDHSVPGSFYIPPHVAALPEEWSFPYQTEMMIRDLQPFPGLYPDHYRYSSPGGGRIAQLWNTETNYSRNGFSEVLKDQGVDMKDPRFLRLMQQIGAKSLLRMFTFYAHKGVHTINAYAIKSEDVGFGILPEAFYEELRKNKYVLNEAVRANAGLQLQGLKEVSDLMRSGKRIDSPRPLQVTELIEYEPRYVYEGDGSLQHPSRYHRDDFAILPYQLDTGTFAIGYYVVTRNAAHAWDPTKDLLDPERYRMPPQTFEFTLNNIYGTGAKVSAMDPLTKERISVETVRADKDSITVKLDSVDYPRFLLIEEAVEGPVIGAPLLEKAPGGARLAFTPSVTGIVYITYGDYPVRSGGRFREESFTDPRFRHRKGDKEVESISYKLGTQPGSWRWTGVIVPEFTEDYTFSAFAVDRNNFSLKLDGQELFPNGSKGVGTASLTAGTAYSFELTYYNEHPVDSGLDTVSLFWSSASQPKTIVPAQIPEQKKLRLEAVKGQRAEVSLPGMTVGDGVRITLVSETGTRTRYPFWDYDTKAVLYEHTPSYIPPTPIPPPPPPPPPPVKGPVFAGGGGGFIAAAEIEYKEGRLLLENGKGMEVRQSGESTTITLLADKILEALNKHTETKELVLPLGSELSDVEASKELAQELTRRKIRLVLQQGEERVQVTLPVKEDKVLLRVKLAAGLLPPPAGFTAAGPQLSIRGQLEASFRPAGGSDGAYLYKYDHGNKTWVYQQSPILREPGDYTWLKSGLSFSDISSHWAKQIIEELAAKGYVSGYENNEFRPNQTVTRAEFAAMLVRMLMSREEAAEVPFKDVTAEDWFYREIGYGYREGLIQGSEEGNFRPGEEISRQEMFALAVRAAERKRSVALTEADRKRQLEAWSDTEQISDWAEDLLAKAALAGLAAGDETGRILPLASGTRAEAAAILLRVLHRQEEQ
ncbi:S-layer homology domain-containing protein [Paenibacillus sp. GD4]|uniref:S-layer homology domain-containing protein n=1 Tax=Paenibacillus sp. GD4 TaxID=3068890 RepID=UPI002796639F|nr:S-layer homology domain-containing protein [Paenibacillus sp. GD4]MDQ1910357.1 S-layer homology domain-containing protein [Paenibacillus sp. GD4]